ncbi:outer membrane protein assembly factor BamC [Vreelandella rituensis]|uniref:Outer membrane protein assembly factor BamC n=1 Tax=Vreelandella rituensis TaxID=2282306 RepID=A0A368U9E9_9GAMM|nr:outer membrane protein assembly factor BamC [Halomonas rituensis]RCV93116.1 outer membrane protein assembly factor BamC [Halomonas rituensis]
MKFALNNPALKWMPLTLVAAMSLAGCARDGFYHDRNLDYVETTPSAPLALPESRDMRQYGDAMPVPPVTSENTRPSEPALVRPPRALAGSGAEQDYVERRDIDGQSWLVVAAPPGAVWSQLEDFVQSRRLGVQESDAERGVIETTQGRIRLESGLRAGNSEVRCERGGQTLGACLDALENHFSARSALADSVSSSLSAQRLDRSAYIQLEQEGDEWKVIIPRNIDRVWAELNHFLTLEFAQEGQHELLSEDPQAHEFIVDYTPSEKRERGFLLGLITPDVSQMSQRIRLALESVSADQTVLRAINASERDLTSQDQRELLERVSSYLR